MPSWLVFLLSIAVMTFTTPANAVPLVEDWSSHRSSYDVHAVAPDRFVIENHPSVKAAKFTVMSGDRLGNSTGERSEVVLGTWRETSPFRVSGNEGTEYYRISVKLDSVWKAPEKNAQGYTWGTFFQLHGPDEYRASPAVALHAEDKFGLFVLGGDMEKKLGGRRFLTKSDLNLGRWVEFILAIKWAPDPSGSIAVFRRDAGESTWEQVADIKSVATLQYRGSLPPKSHYWKAGFYRSESKHVNSLWLGPIVRGRTFAEVAGP